MHSPLTLLTAALLCAPAALAKDGPAAGTPIPRNVTILNHNLPIVPGSKLPPPNVASKADRIVELFGTLGRSTVWSLVEKVVFEGNMGEPEGIVRIGDDRYFITAGLYTVPTVSFGNGTVINGTDRANGEGAAHLFVYTTNGTRIADATLSTLGAAEYHNGGIDYDGEFLWGAIAQYRPNSTAHLFRLDPRTFEGTVVSRTNDHLGGVVHDTKTHRLVALNWGSRNASTWALDAHGNTAKPLGIVRNPSYYIDYQDCKFLGYPRAYQGRGTMLCGGLADIGGMAIVDLETMVPLAEVPLKLTSDRGTQITQNAIDVDVVDGKLRLYLMPDQNNSTLYVYEAQPKSPFEF